MNTTFNKANLAALGPILTTLLVGLDTRFGWGMGDVWMTAAAALLIWVLTYVVPNATPTPANPNLKSFAWLAIALTALVMLSGCSMVPYYSQVKAVADTGIATAVQDRREFNDKKLAVNLAALCDSSVGSVNRLPDASVRDFINRLCGGDENLTMAEIGRLATLLDQATNPQPVQP